MNCTIVAAVAQTEGGRIAEGYKPIGSEKRPGWTVKTGMDKSTELSPWTMHG